jgi:hypothetical protein
VLAIPPKVIASSFALISFTGALVVGFAAGNELSTIVWRAIIVMLVSWPIGRIIGAVAWRATQENIEAYKLAHPIPSDDESGDEPDEQAGDEAGGSRASDQAAA